MNLTTIRTTKILPAGGCHLFHGWARAAGSCCTWVSARSGWCNKTATRQNATWQRKQLMQPAMSPPNRPARPQRLPAANGDQHCRLCRRAGLYRPGAAVPPGGGQQVGWASMPRYLLPGRLRPVCKCSRQPRSPVLLGPAALQSCPPPDTGNSRRAPIRSLLLPLCALPAGATHSTHCSGTTRPPR